MADNTSVTIEQFFLDEYKKTRAENDELKAKVADLEKKIDQIVSGNPDGGFNDLGHSVNLVKVTFNGSSYSIFREDSDGKNRWAMLSVDELKALLDMSDDDLLEYAKDNPYRTYYSSNEYIISIESRKFPFTVSFHTYKGTDTFAYDPDYGSTSLIEYVGDKGTLNEWALNDLLDEGIELAVEKLREIIVERIGDLEVTTEEEDAA